MMPPKRLLLTLLFGIVATLASGFVPTEVYATYPGGLDCDQGCRAAAAGWPFAYVIDGRVTSPAGSADLLGVVLGIDNIRWWPCAANCFSWTLVCAACIWAARMLARKRGATAP